LLVVTALRLRWYLAKWAVGQWVVSAGHSRYERAVEATAAEMRGKVNAWLTE
jgi:hypothetical protein